MTYRRPLTSEAGRHPHIYAAERIAPLDFAAMLRVVWHGKMLILAATMIMTGLAAYYAFRMTSPQYAATATLQLEVLSARPGGASAQPGGDDAALNTELSLVTSDDVLAEVITRIALLSDAEFNRYLTPPGRFALRSLRTNLRHLLAGTSEVGRDDAAILTKTIENLRGRLTVTRRPETYIAHITARSSDRDKAVLLANATAHAYLAHIQMLDNQSQSEADNWLQTRIDAQRVELDSYEMQIEALIATAQLQEDRGLDILSGQILAADQELTQKRDALEIRTLAPAQGETRRAAEITQMQTEINALAALKDRLGEQLSLQSAGLAQLHQLQVEGEAARQRYLALLATLHDSQMRQGLQSAMPRDITAATRSDYVGPRKIWIVVIAAVLGVTLGLLLVAVLHNMRKGVIDARSLREATGLPVLGQFSMHALRQLRIGQHDVLRIRSVLQQSASNLHAALFLQMRQHPARVILSTSSVQGEGKSETAIILAHVLAKAGKQVLLIGADNRDPSLGAMIGKEALSQARHHWHAHQGGAASVILGTDVLVLPEPSDAPILSADFANRLQSLRAQYDHIIIDGPPVLRGAQAGAFAQDADVVLYNVRWSKTPLDVVHRGLETLEDIGCPATGLVLSKVNLRKTRKLSDDPCIGAIEMA